MREFKEKLTFVIKAIEEKYFHRHERDFSYELYHQLRILNLNIDVTSETPKNSYRIPENLINLNFFKNHFFTTENYDVVNNSYNRTPDLLLHEYYNRSRQILACEIKPLYQRDKLIFKDLSKLLFYTESNLRYENGILILFSPHENERKLAQLKNKYQNILVNFPKIEIWIVYPKRVHIIWASGKVANEMF
jgi:hypothetical protein